MSHTVRDLERALRVTLLSRTTRAVEVTPAGRVFAGLASQVLTELESAIGRALTGPAQRARPERSAWARRLGPLPGRT